MKKKLGDLELFPIGLGCMCMSEFYGPIHQEEATKTLIKAIDLGVDFFDTANVYGFGENERLLGKTLKNYRKNISIASKFGIIRESDGIKICGKPDYVKIACEESLRRLNTDYIDLYYLHRIDQNIPIEETVGAMAELVKEGKVRYLGLSEVGIVNIKKAYKIHPIAAVQNEFSLWTRDSEKEIIPLCEQLGIAFVSYSPLGRGFLTNTISTINELAVDDFRRTIPRFNEQNLQINSKLVYGLTQVASSKNCTPAQLAIAWILAKSPRIIPIPGTKRIQYLIENMKSIDIKISNDDVKLLDNLFKEEKISGGRYSPKDMETISF